MLVLGGLAACASTRPRTDEHLITEEDDPAARAAHIGGARPAAPAPAPRPRPPLRRTGSIGREELDVVLDAGPGAFLRGLQVDPELVERRLRGWRVRRFYPDDPRFEAVDLLPGDLVLTVNGHLIVRPEHLQKVWDGLRDAHTLVVQVERAGSVFELEYTIVDSPAPPRSNTAP
jgi:hypothetical protein